MSQTQRPLTEATENRSLSYRVIEAVADAKGTEPAALDPLYHVIEPDALDSLFANTANGRPRSLGRVLFVFAGCEVAIDADENIDVTRRE